MYTVEFEPDAAVIISIDESATCEDIEVIIAEDNVVFLRQFAEELNNHQLICISYQQLLDIMAAIKSPEGAFYARFTKDWNT